MSPSTLPPGWTSRAPEDGDVDDVVGLLAARRRPGDKPVDRDSVTANLVGTGSWTRRQTLVRDASGALVARVGVHDRAAGRSDVELLATDLVGDDVAAALLDWALRAAARTAQARGLATTVADASSDPADPRVTAWLAAAGFERMRRWLHMSRPVSAAAGEPGALPGPRPGVRVRRVRSHPSGLPVAEDVQTVHLMLEESFVDHFNSYRESFAEFVQRLREDPGHRWDHWWIATVETDAGPTPGGALISSVSPPDAAGRLGSYLDYIGVHRNARGHGVAKALLHTLIADTARRGRARVALEVDADSPTGADGLYRSMGWATDYVTETWHRTVDAAAADD